MSRIFWDTNLFIYLLEARGDVLLTSARTLGEILVQPRRIGRLDLVRRCEQALRPPAVTVISFDEDCARIYAEVRQDKTIQAPDAVQLSCCGRAGCDMFVSNDERLSRKVIPGIQFIASLDRALLFTGAGGGEVHGIGGGGGCRQPHLHHAAGGGGRREHGSGIDEGPAGKRHGLVEPRAVSSTLP